MPNVFDQFDPPSTQTAAPVASSSNVFDQFDTSKTGNNVFDQFDSPSSVQTSTTPAADQAAAEPSLVSRAVALAHTPSPQWLQPAETRARAFVEGAGVPGSLKEVKDFVTRSPIQDVKDIYNDVAQVPEKLRNIGQTLSGSPAATVVRAPLSPEAFGVYGTAAGMLIPAAHEALKAPVEAPGTIPAPAPPVAGTETFARVNERAGAAVPADIPAPAQSTILEPTTQPEPKPVVPITEENAAQAATDIGGLSYGGVQSWPADSGILSTLEFTITEPGKETTLSVPPGITPEELTARRDAKLAEYASDVVPEQQTGQTKPETPELPTQPESQAPTETNLPNSQPESTQTTGGTQGAPISGINNERLYQIYGKDAVVSGRGNGPQALQEMGRADTRDPYQVLSNAQRNGIATGADVAKLRDEHNRLLDVARNSYGTPQYPELAQRAVDMANAIKGVAHGPASEVFRALQEVDIPRYTSPADFDNIVRERMQRESTPGEQTAFKKVTDEVNNSDREAVQAATDARTLLRKSRLRAAKEPMQFDDAADYIRKQIADLTKDCIT